MDKKISHRNKSWHRNVQKFVSHPLMTKILAGIVTRIDPPIMHLTHGRVSPSGAVGGFPVAEIATIGAKSGRERIHPIIAIPAGEDIILIASNFGREHHPAWYYNLLANPVARLNMDGLSITCLARQAEPSEYDACWNLAVETYSGFAEYRKQTERHIPIMVLTPVQG